MLMDNPTFLFSDSSAVDAWIEDLFNWDTPDLEDPPPIGPASQHWANPDQIITFNRWFTIIALIARCVIIVYLSYVPDPLRPGHYSLQKSFYVEINIDPRFCHFTWFIDLEWL